MIFLLSFTAGDNLTSITLGVSIASTFVVVIAVLAVVFTRKR